jgi:protein-S-isoprenylcysteine O-methyltransferase Ste14
MRPLIYTSPYSWVFWAVFLFAFVPEFRLVARSRPAAAEKTDRGSMRLIMIASQIAFLAAFAIAWWNRFILANGQKIWFAVGIAVLLSGVGLRRHCFRTLGSYFTANVRVVAGQTVIEDGAYRWIRHPSYTGGMLMYLGTGLAMTNWLSALVLLVVGAIGYFYRVRVEEQALQTNLGEPYRDYMRRTKRFVPFIF